MIQEKQALELNRIIYLAFDVASKKKLPTEAAKEFLHQYEMSAKSFARDKAKELVEIGMSATGIEALSSQSFAEEMISVSETIVSLIKRFIQNKITEDQLISQLSDTGIQDISMRILSALGIHEKLRVDNPADIMKLTPPVLAFIASVAAYKELRKAMDDLNLAKERRIQLEAACQESVSMIRSYRAEMEKIVSDFLTDRLEVFETGFAAMDQALLDGDTDGYIKGNADIQSILGYGTRFSDQKEFDALMASDDAFQL